MKKTIYPEVAKALRAAGYEIDRHTHKDIWKSPDNKRGVAVSRTIKDRSSARTLLRRVGLEL